MEAAEDVTSDDAANGTRSWMSLSRLVDKSLVNVEGDNEGTAVSVPRDGAAIREERLLQSAEAERLRDRHLAFFSELVRRAEPELTRAEQVAWLNRLQREHDNLRLALEWCLGAPERGRQSLELAGALCWFWVKRGDVREGQECVERALSTGTTRRRRSGPRRS